MDFSSCMSAHDIISNEEVLPTFAGYDNNIIGNAQVVCQGGELNNRRVVDVERHDDAYIIKTHGKFAETKVFFRNHIVLLHSHFKMNNNQPMDLEHNQIMRCVIDHNDYASPKILFMCTKRKKGLITYHKSIGI